MNMKSSCEIFFHDQYMKQYNITIDLNSTTEPSKLLDITVVAWSEYNNYSTKYSLPTLSKPSVC